MCQLTENVQVCHIYLESAPNLFMPSSSLSYSGMKCLFISSSWFQLIEVFKGIFLNAKNECDIDVLQLIRIFYHNNYKHFIYWNGPISLLSYICISVCNYIFKQTRALNFWPVMWIKNFCFKWGIFTQKWMTLSLNPYALCF